MKTIAIGNLKGGVGKTTISVNLTYSLSLLGKRLLLIDLDPQCNSTRYFAKVNRAGHSVNVALQHPDKINQMIYRTKYENIDIIRGSAETEAVDIYTLKEALSRVQKQYDFCVIDTRPVLDLLTQNALYAADILLTPIKFDNYCRDNLALVEHFYDGFRQDENPRLAWKIIANMVANAKAQRATMEDLLGRHDYPIMDTCISRSAVIDNALGLYKPVIKHRRNSNTAADYMELAKELLMGGE